MATAKPIGTAWVCVDCLMADEGDGPVEGADCAPWSRIGDCDVTPGLLEEEHSSWCENPEECECEVDTFSRSSCDGCGSHLAGERHAYTMWERA